MVFIATCAGVDYMYSLLTKWVNLHMFTRIPLWLASSSHHPCIILPTIFSWYSHHLLSIYQSSIIFPSFVQWIQSTHALSLNLFICRQSCALLRCLHNNGSNELPTLPHFLHDIIIPKLCWISEISLYWYSDVSLPSPLPSPAPILSSLVRGTELLALHGKMKGKRQNVFQKFASMDRLVYELPGIYTVLVFSVNLCILDCIL